MTRRRTRPSPAVPESEALPADRPRLRSRRWLVILPMLAMLLGLVWLAPQWLANSALRDKILSRCIPNFEGRVQIGPVALGWFSPIVVQEVIVTDASDRPLLQVATLRTEKSLFALLCQPRAPGLIVIDEPRLYLALRRNGSNLEDALAPLLHQPSSVSARSDVRLEIRGGFVEIVQTETAEASRLDQLNIAVNLPGDAAQPVQARLAGRWAASEVLAGTLSADLAWTADPQAPGGLGQGQLAWKTDAWPLRTLQALSRRCGLDLQVQGVLTSAGSLHWADNGQRCLLQLDQLAARDLAVQSPKFLGPETIRTARLEAGGRIEGQGPRWQAQKLTVVADFAKLDADGQLAIPVGAGRQSWESWLNQLALEPIQASGTVDLAQLARMLPRTLHIRPTTQIESGDLKFALASQTTPAPGWTARLEAGNLAATDEGRKIVWEQPLVAVASLRTSPAGPVIEQLTCQASFLNLTGSGSLSQGSATIQGDLQQLAAELGQFVDLSGSKLEGRIDGRLDWQREAEAAVAATGQITLQNFELTVPNRLPWREANLVVKLAATALVPGNQIVQITTATGELQAGEDQFRIKLLQPVRQPATGSVWPLQCEMKGELATWLPRLQPVLPLTNWQVQGTLDAVATAAVATDRISADAVKVECRQLQIRGQIPKSAEPPTFVNVVEPLVRLETAVQWHRTGQQFALQNTAFTSSSVAFRADQVSVKLGEQGLPLEGEFSFRGDVGRILGYLQDPRQAIERQYLGTLSGVMQAKHEAQVTQLVWSGDVKDLVCVVPAAAADPRAPAEARWQELWRQPALTLAGKQTYDQTRDQLQILELSVNSHALRLTAAGQVEHLSTQCVANLNGQVAYDWKDISDMLRPYVGEGFQLTGQETSQFAVQGPGPNNSGTAHVARAKLPVSPTAFRGDLADRDGLAAATRGVTGDLQASTGVDWAAGQLYGLALGPGRLQAKLADSVLRCDPLDLPVNEGRVRVTPWVDLTTASPLLRVDKGRVIENVRISPELCRLWLKYVAPLVADATQAEGRFSMSVDEVAVPLTDTSRSNVHGHLFIHAAQVGPGPLAQEFLGVAQQIRSVVGGGAGGSNLQATPWVLLPEQDVKFDVVDGRVYHQGLTMNVQDMVIRTTGSVGLDQSLALTAEIPIRDEWVANQQLLSSLRGTVLKIPVGGSFAKPQLDRQSLQDIGRQTLRDTAGKMLENQLQRGLERFLPMGQ
ncbi:MAG: hypothetical protein NTY19_33245 [Planctomycetota bacterium]|nr:hypothetical protein [Planctomycetota bacterium]